MHEAEDRDGDDRGERAEPREGLGDEGCATDGDEQRERRRTQGPTEEDVEDQAAHEGKDDAAIDPGCDGPDDAEDEDRM